MNKLINRYYITTFISEFARTIPHPILTILLIDQKGLNLSQITFIQIFFYLGILLFEIPSGYLADLGYRKSTYVYSFICMLSAYGLIYCSSSILLLSIAWFIYGIAGALTSGNIDGYIVNGLKDSGDSDLIKKFNIKKTNISLSAGIAGAVLGSLLYPVIKTNIYLISIFLYTLSIVIAVFGIKIIHQKTTTIKFKLSDIVWSKQLKLLLLMICTIELYYVGFYQYWQVLYQTKSIMPVVFGLIYVIFSITVIASNRLYGKMNHLDNKILMPIFSVAAISSITILNGILFCLIYPITLFIANLYVIDMYTQIYKQVSEAAISSVISIISSANRLFGIVILGVLAVVINAIDLTVVLLLIYGLFVIIFTILSNKFNLINNQKE